MAQGILRDLTGQRFGRLVVLSRGPSDGHGARWHCICDCGTAKLAKAQRLTQGNTRSCGCLQRELNRARFDNPESAARLRASMERSWENGKRRQAYEAKFGTKPAKPPRATAENVARRRFTKDAALDLAKALGIGRRK